MAHDLTQDTPDSLKRLGHLLLAVLSFPFPFSLSLLPFHFRCSFFALTFSFPFWFLLAESKGHEDMFTVLRQVDGAIFQDLMSHGSITAIFGSGLSLTFG